MPKEKKTSRAHRPGHGGDENLILCDDPLAAGRAAAAARRGGASPSALSGLAAAAMYELGALDLGAEDDADRDAFADLPADVVEDLREEIFGPEPAAEGIFVDREEGSESEAALSEGSSSSAEEGASPREERGSAEEGASPSEDPAPGAEVEGGAPCGADPWPSSHRSRPWPSLELIPRWGGVSRAVSLWENCCVWQHQQHGRRVHHCSPWWQVSSDQDSHRWPTRRPRAPFRSPLGLAPGPKHPRG